MRIALAGGIQFFKSIGRQLIEKDYPISLVILSKDKATDKLTKEVSRWGKETWVVDNIDHKEADFRDQNIDLLLCIEFPQILKKNILQLPRLGCINLHTSLLPHYRGRHPVTWAMVKEEPTIGITLHYMSEAIDEGDMILQDEIKVHRNDDYLSVLDRLLPLGAKMVELGIQQISQGNVYRRKQNPLEGSYLRKRTPEDSKLDWSANSKSISAKINALVDPMPNAFTTQSDRTVSFKRSYPGTTPGEVIAKTTDGKYVIATGDGVVLVQTDQELPLGTILG